MDEYTVPALEGGTKGGVAPSAIRNLPLIPSFVRRGNQDLFGNITGVNEMALRVYPPFS